MKIDFVYLAEKTECCHESDYATVEVFLNKEDAVKWVEEHQSKNKTEWVKYRWRKMKVK